MKIMVMIEMTITTTTWDEAEYYLNYSVNFNEFDNMNSEEIKSLLKSNRLSKNTRALINFKLATISIEEMLGVIAIIGITAVVSTIIHKRLIDAHRRGELN